MSKPKADDDMAETTADLARIISQLHRNERELLRDVAERLLMGQETYGPFREDDPRNMRREAYMEHLDGIVYLARDLRKVM